MTSHPCDLDLPIKQLIFTQNKLVRGIYQKKKKKKKKGVLVRGLTPKAHEHLKAQAS